jgi:hypothetical protein
MTFERYSPIMDRTLLLKRLNNHQTQLNEMYWAHFPIISCADFIARRRPNKTPKEAFHASGKDVHRLASNMSDYKTHLDDYSNWTRLNSLMAAVSFFEIYFKSVINTALISDPGIVKGKSQAIDGIILYKIDIHDDYQDEIKDCIVGDWPKRSGTYKRIFGSSPLILEDNISTLETIRELRNGIGHAFGRDPDAYEDQIGIFDPPMSRLTHDTLIKYISILDKISKAIDNQLLQNHIGNFELLQLFHTWKQGKSYRTLKEFANGYNDYLKCEGICNPSKRFCEILVGYYNSK